MHRTFEPHCPELHLFIIWNNGYQYKEKIIAQINERFDVKLIKEINWHKDDFSQNLRRFYGKNLPEKSKKEKECGVGEFTLLVVEDKDPIYALRYTNQGATIVNANAFDMKELFRNMIGKNFLHATNTKKEFEHDISLLLGYNTEDLISTNYLQNLKDDTSINSMPGSSGWNSMEELLYTINSTSNYVILRNFENYPESIQYGKHSDIDILCDNYKTMQLVLNGKPTSTNKKRVQNKVRIGNSYVNIDIRHVGDGYMDKQWEEDILANRVKNKKGFYTPNDENYLYSIIYHAIVQKNRISDDYAKRVKKLSRKVISKEIDLKNEQESIGYLKNFMDEKKYVFTEPQDPTVAYNYHKLGMRASAKRTIHHIKHNIGRRIKR